MLGTDRKLEQELAKHRRLSNPQRGRFLQGYAEQLVRVEAEAVGRFQTMQQMPARARNKCDPPLCIHTTVGKAWTRPAKAQAQRSSLEGRGDAGCHNLCVSDMISDPPHAPST
jgi:hypothetical protein